MIRLQLGIGPITEKLELVRLTFPLLVINIPLASFSQDTEHQDKKSFLTSKNLLLPSKIILLHILYESDFLLLLHPIASIIIYILLPPCLYRGTRFYPHSHHTINFVFERTIYSILPLLYRVLKQPGEPRCPANFVRSSPRLRRNLPSPLQSSPVNFITSLQTSFSRHVSLCFRIIQEGSPLYFFLSSTSLKNTNIKLNEIRPL